MGHSKSEIVNIYPRSMTNMCGFEECHFFFLGLFLYVYYNGSEFACL